ncbi:MAG TPA: pyruvate formate lyase family protein [Anaerolineales bacterium]|nr:pyruvate formate lyase family protein [Anaerolineales bacterium]
MNERLIAMKNRVREGAHRSLRQDTAVEVLEECESRQLSWSRRVACLVRRQCEAEQTLIEPDEQIVFTRTLLGIPPIYSPEDWASLTEGRTMHELGPVSNICADWSLLLSQGLDGRKRVALATRERMANDPKAVEFLDSALETIDAVLGLAARYAEKARQMGRGDIADILDHVPAQPPRTFHEALQSLRLCQAVVWLGGNYHVGLGRFDQYMWPFLNSDLQAGHLTLETAEELLAEFFISLNKDSDLYPGVQQGDNGQSLTLGGVTPTGELALNELTRMVLRVSRDLGLIDPKINLRISPQTDLDLLSLATELTRIGLGFPQYSNDDVVIPALVAHGYAPEDARDYVVAACWEFIIPGRGMEVVNIGAVSFPAAVDKAIREGLRAQDDFKGLLGRVSEDIHMQVHRLGDVYASLLLPPAPYYSVFMHGCLEQGKDLSKGLKYNNFGIHGACAANAADALAAVNSFVYEDHSISLDDLISALEADFHGYEALRQKLVEEGPKVGNNDEAADTLLAKLFTDLADACESYGLTPRRGILRPGTGSAMYYIWLAQGHDGMREPSVGATAEGRLQGEPFSANLSPSLGVRVRGPISTLQSFAKIDYQRVFNGGPITMELSDTVFRNPESIRKTAMLVRTFAQLGCQQLQLNSLNLATLLDAKAHPEKHQNLIVRVWGWSGYFCELAPEYQDQIIARHYFE